MWCKKKTEETSIAAKRLVGIHNEVEIIMVMWDFENEKKTVCAYACVTKFMRKYWILNIKKLRDKKKI